jgi:hypothetical protein
MENTINMENDKMYTHLNLFPIYAHAVRQKTKTSSARLGDKRNDVKVGQQLTLTLGWNPETAANLARVEVTSVICKRINKVTAHDLQGETIEARNPLALPYILGLIYKRQIYGNENVTIIKWRYL